MEALKQVETRTKLSGEGLRKAGNLHVRAARWDTAAVWQLFSLPGDDY